MAVRVRTARLRSRLGRMARELPRAAAQANFELAEYAARQVVAQAEADGWRSESDQVGFDFDKWVSNARIVETTGEGSLGILNVQRMGTAEDFEKIAQSPKSVTRDELLWHTGLRMGDSFRRLIIERPANRTALAQARQAVWGDTTPQWWFKNYGNLFAGAYPQSAGTYSIETAAFGVAGDVEQVISRYVNAYLKSVGLLI